VDSRVDSKRALRILWVLAILTVVIGSILPSDSAPIRALNQLDISDKFEHVVAYLVLAALPAVHERGKFIVAAALGAAALGIALEYVQLFSGWRDFEVADMVADAAGVCLGAVIGWSARSLVASRLNALQTRTDRLRRRAAPSASSPHPREISEAGSGRSAGGSVS